MTRIKTIDQFDSIQKYGKSGVTFLGSCNLTHVTEKDIQVLFDGCNAYFGNPSKSLFDAKMFCHIVNEFLKQFFSFLDDINLQGCNLEEEVIPKTVKEMTEIVIPETTSRMQSLHIRFSCQLKVFDYSKWKKLSKVLNCASSRHENNLMKITVYFFIKEEKN